MIVHLALDGVMEGALGLGLDVVDTAARLLRAGAVPSVRCAPSLVQRVVTHDGHPVRSAQGRSITPDGGLGRRALGVGDVLVVPGVRATSDGSVERLLARPDARAAIAAIERAAGRGALVATSCAATFLAGAAGVLDGRPATTTWWLMPSFARRFPRVTLTAERMVVDGGGVLTAGAAFAHADLMLAVVARAATPATSNLTARYLVLDTRPSQSRYTVMDHLRDLDPSLRALESFVAKNIARQLPLDELARAAGTSPRTLARRVAAGLGMTPQRFVQRVRVAHAAHLLATTDASVEDVAARVGYADAAAFRRVFRAHTGESPRGATHRSPPD